MEHYGGRLLAKNDQGKVYDVTARNGVGNHFLRDGKSTHFAEWRFVHRAHLDILPLNATRRWRVYVDKRCRKCGAGLETLPHVIQYCGTHSTAITKRHDGVLHRLINATKVTGAVAVNRCVAGVDEESAQVRPDIDIRDDVQRKVTIIDVAIPFENRISAFNDARDEKLSKYHPLAENLR